MLLSKVCCLKKFPSKQTLLTIYIKLMTKDQNTLLWYINPTFYNEPKRTLLELNDQRIQYDPWGGRGVNHWVTE